ncbi:hypothetical protein BUE80_DR010117 [Diplocarpon rosae]|nr:hypothetical protein BUE80_DR010117 [Diplocarpon rosae]
MLLECPLPKLLIASLILMSLLSLVNSFAFSKYKEISNNPKDINLENYKANKAEANKAFTKSSGK